MVKAKKIISINGNIGSGKSTLMNLLKEKLDDRFIFVREPVDIWQSIKDKDNKDLLMNFYENQEKYSFPFQMCAYISILDLLKQTIKENPNKIIITDRCVHTARHVFTEMLHDDNKLNDLEYQIYNMWFNSFLEDMKDFKYIYIKTSPNICLERIQKRQRNGENNISLEYLSKCDDYHNRWLEKEHNTTILNGDICFNTDNNILDEWIKLIENITTLT